MGNLKRLAALPAALVGTSGSDCGGKSEVNRGGVADPADLPHHRVPHPETIVVLVRGTEGQT